MEQSVHYYLMVSSMLYQNLNTDYHFYSEIVLSILMMEDPFWFDHIVLKEYKDPRIVLIMVSMEFCMTVH